jgi:ribosomal-protein-alanine N-acetyltransferase
MSTATQYHVRWLMRRDLDEVLYIERGTSDKWDESDISSQLRQRNCIAVVAESSDGPIDGWMCYELHLNHIELIRIAVCTRDRRCGIGTRLIERLKDKLEQQRRNRIEVIVAGHSLTAQMFFSACGFHATPMADDLIRFEFWTH